MHPFSLSLFHYLSETSGKMSLLLLLFSKARSKLDETGVLIRAESIISVYIRSGRDEGGARVQLMKCCGRTSLRDACCRLHLRLIMFCAFSAIWPLGSSSIASVRTERSEPWTAPGSGRKLRGDDNPDFTLCCARQYWNSDTSDTKRGRFRIDSHVVKCWIFPIICIILPGLCFKPEKEVTVLFIGPISWQLNGTTGMFQNKTIPSLLLVKGPGKN